MLAQGQGDIPFLPAKSRTCGGAIQQAGPTYLRRDDGIDGVLHAPQQKPGPGVEVSAREIPAVIGARRHLGWRIAAGPPEGNNPEAKTTMLTTAMISAAKSA